jgi:hypothetical protein
MKKTLLLAATILLTSCSGLPKLSVTPVSADLKVGGQHDTGTAEDNMVKVQTGDTSQTEYVTDKVEQTYNEIQEYPLWLILAFAFCLPSPLSSFSHWRTRRRLEKQIAQMWSAQSQAPRSVVSSGEQKT